MIYCKFCYLKCKLCKNVEDGTEGYVGVYKGYSVWEYPPETCECFT